jgi:hypothetical protein
MSGVSRITGYRINSAYSNFDGQAGGSSTTTGVGGVGAYHHHHRSRVGNSSHPGKNGSEPDNTTSDLVDLLKASNDPQYTRGQFLDKFA